MTFVWVTHEIKMWGEMVCGITVVCVCVCLFARFNRRKHVRLTCNYSTLCNPKYHAYKYWNGRKAVVGQRQGQVQWQWSAGGVTVFPGKTICDLKTETQTDTQPLFCIFQVKLHLFNYSLVTLFMLAGEWVIKALVSDNEKHLKNNNPRAGFMWGELNIAD